MDRSVTEALFTEAAQVYKENQTLTDDILSTLQFVFQAPLLPALDLVDKKEVTQLKSPSGSSAYQVIGSSGTPYLCPASVDYCSCQAFRFSVLQKNEHPLCKHLLAIRLSQAMNAEKVHKVTDVELSDLLKQVD